VVLVNRTAPIELAGCVRVDDEYGARLAVRHLLHSGRHNIGLLSGPPISYGSRMRAMGFAAGLREAGRTPESAAIRPCAPDMEGGYQAARALLTEQPELNALVCYNDLVAIGTLRACAELGVRVPEDLAIVGFDDITLAGMVTPSLTTLHVSKSDIGAHAVGMLLSRIHNGDGQNEIILTPRLIVRASAP
jgi:LacI family transcriptional regulator